MNAQRLFSVNSLDAEGGEVALRNSTVRKIGSDCIQKEALRHYERQDNNQ
jgi:hypothetical protein